MVCCLPVLNYFLAIATDLARPLSTTRGLATAVFSLMGGGLALSASFVRTMVPLRALTVCSNVMLLAAAFSAPNPASVVLFLLLVPLNTYRLREIVLLTRRVQSASDRGDLSGIWLKPYMRARRLTAGEVLFRQGDKADALYLLLEGELKLVEIDKLQVCEQLFGEISFFSPEGARTLTAQCVTSCVVLSIEESVFKQLYFQNPRFAFQVSNLIAHRLGADIKRLQDRIRVLEGQNQVRNNIVT